MKIKLSYLHNNPARAGLVGMPEDYFYSSGKDYAGEKGLVDVFIISHAMLGFDN